MNQARDRTSGQETGHPGQRKTGPAPKTPRRLFSLFLLFAVLFAAGCSGDSPPSEPGPNPEPCQNPESYSLPFELEYRVPGTLTFSLCDGTLEGALVLEKDFDFLQAGKAYSGRGKLFTFPESGHRLYTWTIPLPEAAPGTCVEGTAVLSLSLSSHEDWQTLSGGLTAYCGDRTHGQRPLKVMRLSGLIKQTEEPRP